MKYLNTSKRINKKKLLQIRKNTPPLAYCQLMRLHIPETSFNSSSIRLQKIHLLEFGFMKIMIFHLHLAA
ncbi:hypothetical protein X975_04001, partial [Stegodyphus mimosarum]